MEFTTTLSTNEPVAITIGNFDGVHRGHLRLLSALRAVANELHCQPVLVTFSPHTLMVVRPESDFHYLTTLEEKLALVKSYAEIADSIVIHFTPQVAAMSAEAFLDSLRATFPLRALVVGTNFTLGHDRLGDVAFLQQYGRRHDLLVRPVALEQAAAARINSTHIRQLVSAGDVRAANALLGHPVIVREVVRQGDRRGRLLGFPTANLIPEAHKLVPAGGVYAARVHLDDHTARDAGAPSSVYKGAANIGVRPTFQGKERIVEVHLLDIQPDLYDQRITIEFIERLRSEQRFASIDALKAQIAADVEQVRHLLQEEM